MLSLSEFLRSKYSYNDKKYNPYVRGQDLIDVIYSIKRDGLKVTCNNNSLYIHNTVSDEKILIRFNENGKIKWYFIKHKE